MYKIMMFEGGVYRFKELKELVQDIGGFVIQEMTLQSDVLMHLALPAEAVSYTHLTLPTKRIV